MCPATKNLERSRMLHVQFLNLYGGINLIIWIDTVTRDADGQPRIGVFCNLGLQIPERSTDIIFGIVQTSDQIIYGRIYIGRWSSHADLPLPALMDFSLHWLPIGETATSVRRRFWAALRTSQCLPL